MRVLRLGMSGTDVGLWQTFLCGLKYQVEVTGTFDDCTVSATRSFQKLSSIAIDGVVGPMTMSKALAMGYSIMVDTHNNDYPPPPTDLHALSPRERVEMFGQFAYVSDPRQNNPEAIKITDDWAQRNIRRTIVNVQGKTFGVDFHAAAIDQLHDLFTAWDSAGLMDRVLTWDGSWSPRFIRGSRTVLSNHAYGTAFDINVQWNTMGTTPAHIGQKGSVRELVQLANEHGFWWGGHFHDRLDGQHFEISRLI